MNKKEIIMLKKYYNKYLFDNQIIDYEIYNEMEKTLSKLIGE